MSKNKSLVILSIVILLSLACFVSPANAEKENENLHQKVYYFWGTGCAHCKNVVKSGILEEVGSSEFVDVYSLEVYNNQTNRELYHYFADKLGISVKDRGIPFLVIEVEGCGENYSYLMGDSAIIENLKEKVFGCSPVEEIDPGRTSSDNKNAERITLWSIIIAALVDSINPCAFGVLIFLLATMLSMSSPKRALKYGLLYVLIIFIVYFSAGMGLMKILMNYSDAMNYVILAAAIIVLIGGIIEIKDFFWYGKGVSLRIPSRVKPFLERISKKGTVWAVILLGIVVALVELPCTGGIYLAILSVMHVNKTFGVGYLFLYNLIFVLPLLAMVVFAYFGTKTQKITKWTEEHKKWMRLAAGIVMVALSVYLLNSIYNFI